MEPKLEWTWPHRYERDSSRVQCFGKQSEYLISCSWRWCVDYLVEGHSAEVLGSSPCFPCCTLVVLPGAISGFGRFFRVFALISTIAPQERGLPASLAPSNPNVECALHLYFLHRRPRFLKPHST